MKEAKNKIVLALMLLTVIVSGCTGGNQEDDEGSSSVTVSEYSAFPNPVPASQNTQFRMQLINDGDNDAESVYARVYNPPFGTDSSQVWKNTDNSEVTKADRTMSFEPLRAAGEQTPAVPKTEQLDFEAPDLGEDRDVGYTFMSDIMFNYSTNGDAEIQVMGEDTYREQGSPQGSAGLQNSKGPVQMEIRTPTPIPIYDTTEEPVEKQLCVIARNQGSGVPFSIETELLSEEKGFNISQLQENKDEVKIEIPDVGSINFSNPDHPARNYRDVQILDGRGVGCFDMEISDVSDTLQRTIPIRVDAYYGYKKQARTNVQVQGRR